MNMAVVFSAVQPVLSVIAAPLAIIFAVLGGVALLIVLTTVVNTDTGMTKKILLVLMSGVSVLGAILLRSIHANPHESFSVIYQDAFILGVVTVVMTGFFALALLMIAGFDQLFNGNRRRVLNVQGASAMARSQSGIYCSREYSGGMIGLGLTTATA